MNTCRDKALWTNDPIAIKIGPGGYGSYSEAIDAILASAEIAATLTASGNQSGMALAAGDATTVLISSSGRYRMVASLEFTLGTNQGDYSFTVFPRVTTFNGLVTTDPTTEIKGGLIANYDNTNAATFNSSYCEFYADLEVGDTIQLIYRLNFAAGGRGSFTVRLNVSSV